MDTNKPTHTPGLLAVRHGRDCDGDCRAGEDGIIYAHSPAPGQVDGVPAGPWVAYYAHDTPGDDEGWKGAWFQVIAEASTEPEVRAAIAKAEGGR